MKFRFQQNYFMAFLFLLALEICIATFIEQGFIRHTFGDFLVVILLYCFLKSLIDIQVWSAAILVLLFSYIIEGFQYFKLMKHLNLNEYSILNLILGSTFSIQDLVAYFLGILATVIFELKILKNE